MENLNIEKFDPSVAELEKMVEISKQITVTDFLDREQIAEVKNGRLVLRDARVAITKKGKELRQSALDFQRLVIAKEHELIDIIEPEEERLAGLEDQAAILMEREERKKLLPHRKGRLAAIKDGIEVSDDELLDMESDVFEGYFNRRMAEKNAADRKVIDEAQAKVDEEKNRIAKEEEAKAIEERARKAAEEKLAREKQETERKAAEAKKKLEEEASYRKFLTDNGWTREHEDDFYTTQSVGGTIILWKKVAEYPPPDLDF